jgi:hypothetical protein
MQSLFGLDHVRSIRLGYVFGQLFQRQQDAVGCIAAPGLLLRQVCKEQRLVS